MYVRICIHIHGVHTVHELTSCYLTVILYLLLLYDYEYDVTLIVDTKYHDTCIMNHDIPTVMLEYTYTEKSNRPTIVY